MSRNWKGNLKIIIYDISLEFTTAAEQWVWDIRILARLARNIQEYFSHENLQETVHQIERADVNISPLTAEDIDLRYLRNVMVSLETSCIFIVDGGIENSPA